MTAEISLMNMEEDKLTWFFTAEGKPHNLLQYPIPGSTLNFCRSLKTSLLSTLRLNFSGLYLDRP